MRASQVTPLLPDLIISLISDQFLDTIEGGVHFLILKRPSFALTSYGGQVYRRRGAVFAKVTPRQEDSLTTYNYDYVV
ncbi:MAG: hypothetical protein ACSHYA_18360 [Opitutaceae bacterium]